MVCIGLSFVNMGDSLVQVALTIFGTAGGPLIGIFTLGMFFTFTESWVSRALLVLIYLLLLTDKHARTRATRSPVVFGTPLSCLSNKLFAFN